MIDMSGHCMQRHDSDGIRAVAGRQGRNLATVMIDMLGHCVQRHDYYGIRVVTGWQG